jgi:hypothetical protein
MSGFSSHGVADCASAGAANAPKAAAAKNVFVRNPFIVILPQTNVSPVLNKSRTIFAGQYTPLSQGSRLAQQFVIFPSAPRDYVPLSV